LRLAPKDGAAVPDQLSPSSVPGMNFAQFPSQDQLDDFEIDEQPSAMKSSEHGAGRKQLQGPARVKLKLARAKRLPFRSEAKRVLVRQAWTKPRGRFSSRKGTRLGKGQNSNKIRKNVHFPSELNHTSQEGKDDSRSVCWGGSEADYMTEPFRGAWDACSQSSRLSCVGSVTAACRQLLGPLHDHLPPPQLLSKRVEDHVHCAAEMVRLRASAKIKTLHHQQQLQDWQRRRDGHVASTLLSQSRPPQTGIDEQVWRSHLLPHLHEPTPGQRPAEPNVPDDTELWYQAWMHTYESGSDSDSEGSSSNSEGRPVPHGPAQQTRLTARTDPRIGWR